MSLKFFRPKSGKSQQANAIWITQVHASWTAVCCTMKTFVCRQDSLICAMFMQPDASTERAVDENSADCLDFLSGEGGVIPCKVYWLYPDMCTTKGDNLTNDHPQPSTLRFVKLSFRSKKFQCKQQEKTKTK